MELKLDKEPVLLTETVYDGQTEQGIEIEHVLPDYCPDVFKLIKSTLTPRIVSYSVSGSKLFIDGVVYVKVLYIGEEGSGINVVDQRYTYSKTVDLAREIRDPVVYIFPSVEYCTARAVSGRRIDIRGAVSLRIKVRGVYDSEILCGAEGMGTEVLTDTVSVCDERLCGGSQYIVREDIETGAGGGISAVISSSATAVVTDTKVIADKVVVKGEAGIKALYIIKNSSGESSVESMEASVPLSRIVDLNGVTEQHIVLSELDIMDMSLDIKQGDDGESRTFGCDMTIECRVCAYKESQIKAVKDLYSTDYDSSFTVTPVKLESAPKPVTAQYSARTDIEYNDGNIDEIYDADCTILGITSGASENGRTKLNIRLLFRMTGRNSEGVPIACEKNETLDVGIDVPPDESFTILPGTHVSGISFGITGDNTAEIRAQVNVIGTSGRTETINVINEITINEDKPRQKDTEYALRLYFADEGEKVWDISKHYNTSAAAMIAENDLDGESAEVSGMILIPIV